MSEWQTPASNANRNLSAVGAVVEAVQEIGVELPADMVTAATTLQNLNDLNLGEDPTPAAIEAHVVALVSAAAAGKTAPVKDIAAAVAETAALGARKVALSKAKDQASGALVQATRASEEALIESVRPAFDKALADLESAVDAIPATLVSLHDITTAGLSKEWIKANDAVDTILRCYAVRDGLRALGVKAAVDQPDDYGWLRDSQEKHLGANRIDNPTDRFISMIRGGCDLWLSTAAQHEAHYRSLLDKQRAAQQPQSDPKHDALMKQRSEDWKALGREAAAAEVARRKAQDELLGEAQ